AYAIKSRRWRKASVFAIRGSMFGVQGGGVELRHGTCNLEPCKLFEGDRVKCHSCSNAATVHLTEIVNGHKREVHLCQACAEKKQVLHQQELNLSAILQSVIGPHIGALTEDLARLACPECGIKYMEFKAEGRLGCPHDYQVFHTALEPLLQRIHRAT